MQLQDASFGAACGKLSQLPKPERCEFAFIGRSNVGKSTLINKLTGRRSLARVSAVPGKTATINFYDVGDAWLVDLPGYGYAKTSKSEQQRLARLITGYLAADRDIRLVVQLIDMRHAPSKDDIAMIEHLIDEELPFIIVFTKADKLGKQEREQRMASFTEEIPCFEDIHCIPFSAKTGEGRDALVAVLEELAEDDEDEEDADDEDDTAPSDPAED
ncbi:MAG: YihA family ribosome biogenesis GTP-binding protein [Oscillospiraceae bacterium]|nr:YihA family ribosome biogenesis GTP-binding protein [Oscillospiraceae bacterium]